MNLSHQTPSQIGCVYLTDDATENGRRVLVEWEDSDIDVSVPRRTVIETLGGKVVQEFAWDFRPITLYMRSCPQPLYDSLKRQLSAKVDVCLVRWDGRRRHETLEPIPEVRVSRLHNSGIELQPNGKPAIYRGVRIELRASMSGKSPV